MEDTAPQTVKRKPYVKSKLEQRKQRAEEHALQVFEKRNRAFRTLFDTVLQVEGVDDRDIYKILCHNLRKICDAEYAALASYNPETGALKLEAVDGSESIDSFSSDNLFGFKPVPITSEMVANFKADQVMNCSDHKCCLYSIFPKEAMRLTSDSLQGRCYRLSCVRENDLVVAGMIILPPDKRLKLKDIVDTYLNTSALIVERINAVNSLKTTHIELKRHKDSLEEIVIERTTGLRKANEKLKQEIVERKQAEEALRESEEKYRTILANIEDGYFEADLSENLTFFNDSLCKIFGYSRDELMGMNNRQYTDEENAKKLYQTFNKVYTTGKPDKGFGYEILRKDGTKIVVEASISLRKDVDGKPIGFRGIVRDVTEKQKIEDQLQHAKKMEAIGTLAGGVAHDLNNILGGLVGYPELLLLQLREGSPLRKSVLTIQKSGEKAAAVVQDLLTLARRGVVATEIVNLNDVITDYLKSPEYEKLQSYHHGVHLETHLEKDALNILGSSTHLSKTVMNLVSNAAEAMPEGGKLTVSTENRYLDRPIKGYDDVREGDYVVLTISDTGTGIASNDLEKIFEPFYTKKKMGRSGTGLGMAVVWGTVKDHNGYIDVQSTEGKGTTFTLYFPVTRKSVEEKSEISLRDFIGKGEAILVVDDVEEQRNIASGMLKELGYSVVSVSSGEEAVEYLKANKVDLLVLDMIMDPGMDGLDTYKKILELHPGQKAIIASGFSETDHVKEVQRLGAGAYIRKPLLLGKIGIAVKGELEK